MSDTILHHLLEQGLRRRDFLKLCGAIGGMMGFETPPLRRIARALASKPRLPIIWLEFQDDAGCTESISRSLSPRLSSLVLEAVTVDYHETLMAAAGIQAEEARKESMRANKGTYVLVVEGAPTIGDGGVYCTIGGRSSMDLLREAADGAAAVIAVGNCATFGGVPAASPNPTTARGVMDVIKDRPVVNVPGCPPIPEVITGTVLHFIVMGALPRLDSTLRPLVFYRYTIHDHCLRRPFYDRGKFAGSFDDERAREGYCLYKLGCKGPTAYNACSSLKWQRGLSFPVQSGHPCFACSMPHFWDNGGFYQSQSAPLVRPAVPVALGAVGVGAALGLAIGGADRQKRRRAGRPGPPAGPPPKPTA